MAQEHVHVVLAEGVGPAQLLLHIVVLVAVNHLFGTAGVALAVADDGVVVGMVVAIAHVQVSLDGEGEVLQEVEIHESNAVQGVAHGFVGVQLVLPDHMAVRVLVTGAVDGAVGGGVGTRVELLVAELVQDVFARGDVVQVHRIDGGNLAAVHERVHETGVAVAHAGGIQRALVAAGKVQAHLHVGNGLDVHHGAAGETVEAGVAQEAVFIQVTQGEISIGLVGGGAGCDVVLLTAALADGLVEPVQVVCVSPQDLGVGHQFTVGGEQGVVGLVVDVQVQHVADQVGAGIGVGRCQVVAMGHAEITQVHPFQFHELVGAGQVVLLDSALEDTLFHIQGHRHAAGGIGALGGNQDNTVGGAVAV